MKKILFYTMTMKYGGTERTISNIANYLSIDDEVIIVSNIKCKSHYPLNKNIKYITIDKYDKSYEKIPKKIFTKLSMYRTKKLDKIIQEEKPDTIFLFLPESTIRGLSLKNKYPNIKFITAIRNDPKFEFNIPFGSTIRNCFYKKSDLFIFQTNSYLKYFDGNIKNKSIIIPNMISEEYLISNDSKPAKKIVTVCRLVKQKNIKLLIDSFRNLSNIYSDYILEICGNGPLYDNLVKYINRLGMNKKIFIYRDVKDIKSKIKNAKLFVLPSKYEGISNSLLEALFLGLPVVCTNSSLGIRELIEDNDLGILVKNNNVKELTKAINEALIDSNNQILRKKTVNIKKLINNDSILNKWKSII